MTHITIYNISQFNLESQFDYINTAVSDSDKYVIINYMGLSDYENLKSVVVQYISHPNAWLITGKNFGKMIEAMKKSKSIDKSNLIINVVDVNANTTSRLYLKNEGVKIPAENNHDFIPNNYAKYTHDIKILQYVQHYDKIVFVDKNGVSIIKPGTASSPININLEGKCVFLAGEMGDNNDCIVAICRNEHNFESTMFKIDGTIVHKNNIKIMEKTVHFRKISNVLISILMYHKKFAIYDIYKWQIKYAIDNKDMTDINSSYLVSLPLIDAVILLVKNRHVLWHYKTDSYSQFDEKGEYNMLLYKSENDKLITINDNDNDELQYGIIIPESHRKIDDWTPKSTFNLKAKKNERMNHSTYNHLVFINSTTFIGFNIEKREYFVMNKGKYKGLKNIGFRTRSQRLVAFYDNKSRVATIIVGSTFYFIAE